MKNKQKTTWVFVFQKYGKFWSILLGHFIKHKPLSYEDKSELLYVDYVPFDFVRSRIGIEFNA